MPSLEEKLQAALKSREDRQIRRQLSDPTSDVGLVDFHTNDYLSLSSSRDLRSRFLEKLHAAPNVLGSGGSRLLVNGAAHHALETRLAEFFGSPCALLFNSGFDANVGLFACVPQEGDTVVFDEYIHASVHDGVRSSRAKNYLFSFEHNSLTALGGLLLRLLKDRPGLTEGTQSIFVAVESLYSMDGTLAPLLQIVEMMETLFPKGNGYVVVDEAHATGVYGPNGKGLVALLGLERRVLARLHTFGKALAGSGGGLSVGMVSDRNTELCVSAVVLTNTLVRDYMLNYARSLIYTTSLSYANIIAVGCSFDLLEDGTAAPVCIAFPSIILVMLMCYYSCPRTFCASVHFSPQHYHPCSAPIPASHPISYPCHPIYPLHHQHLPPCPLPWLTCRHPSSLY